MNDVRVVLQPWQVEEGDDQRQHDELAIAPDGGQHDERDERRHRGPPQERVADRDDAVDGAAGHLVVVPDRPVVEDPGVGPRGVGVGRVEVLVEPPHLVLERPPLRQRVVALREVDGVAREVEGHRHDDQGDGGQDGVAQRLQAAVPSRAAPRAAPVEQHDGHGRRAGERARPLGAQGQPSGQAAEQQPARAVAGLHVAQGEIDAQHRPEGDEDVERGDARLDDAYEVGGREDQAEQRPDGRRPEPATERIDEREQEQCR